MAFKGPVLAILTTVAVVFLDDIPQMLRYWFLLFVGLVAELAPVFLKFVRYGENVMGWLTFLCVGHGLSLGCGLYSLSVFSNVGDSTVEMPPEYNCAVGIGSAMHYSFHKVVVITAFT